MNKRFHFSFILINLTILCRNFNIYFKFSEVEPFHSRSFLLDNKFEFELFYSLPFTKQEHTMLVKKHNDAFNIWIGALIHIVEMSKIDIVYSVMILCGYNATPSVATFKALNHLIQ